MSLKESSDAPATSAKEAAPKKRKSRAKPAASLKSVAAESKAAEPRPAKADAPAEAPREFVMPDLGRLAINLLHAANLGQKAARLLMKNEDAASDMNHTLHDLQRVGKTLMDVAASYMRNPVKIVEAQTALVEGYLNLMTSMTRRFLGEDVPPVAAPSRSDKRFRDPDWQENLVFDLMKQSYLLTAKWMTDRVKLAEDVDPHTREKADFYV
ncbi:MAG: class I poly(R)-hydroxyalkanoic acid synthase, partial [Parvibaculum sp.]|nr:class I poly(R)-hydroxyalkanoic acid synthase [Parvibaculum sp.]